MGDARHECRIERIDVDRDVDRPVERDAEIVSDRSHLDDFDAEPPRLRALMTRFADATLAKPVEPDRLLAAAADLLDALRRVGRGDE